MRNQNIMLALTLVGLTFCLPGCNTVKGVGKDIHDSAQAVQTWVEGSDKNADEVSNNNTGNSTARAN
jgi:predicted small secreted protein